MHYRERHHTLLSVQEIASKRVHLITTKNVGYLSRQLLAGNFNPKYLCFGSLTQKSISNDCRQANVECTRQKWFNSIQKQRSSISGNL